jgi:hypothetical protein
MAPKSDEQKITVSFHYLIRNRPTKDGIVDIPITDEEFEELYERLDSYKFSSLDDDSFFEDVRVRKRVVIERVHKHSDCITGIYKSSYSGHSYENTDHGLISASSLNLRPFFFLLHRSRSGKIYIASQYLGNLGGYSGLRSTLVDLMNDPKDILARTFNSEFDEIENSQPREVTINYSKKPTSISSAGMYGKRGTIAFKKQSKDDGFEQTTHEWLLSLTKIDKPIRKMKIQELLKQQELLDVSDDEIEDCKVVVALEGGGTRVVHLLDHHTFATKFAVDVKIEQDGHPHYDQMIKETKLLLQEKILERKEHD